MEKDSQLESIKQIFNNYLPTGDKRSTIQLIDFIPALALSFSGDSKIFSLEAIRRKMMGFLEIEIPRSTFWDRISTKSLTTHLQNIIGHVMGQVEIPYLHGSSLMKALNIKSIQLIDSTSISLWDNLREIFPGTRTTAGVKWHACFDLLSGMLTWFDISSTSSNDRKYFPNPKDLSGILSIFDLGYYDYGLMKEIDDCGGFFLSRVKRNSNIKILLPVEGIGKNLIGSSISDIKESHKIIDFIGEVYGQKYGRLEMRVVGFWNQKEKIYHWYTTNLSVDAKIIYPLYCCRWKIELIFKSCKTSLNLNEIPTGNKNIVMNLFLSSILAYLISLLVLDVTSSKLSDREQQALTVQRVGKVMVHLSFDFFNYFMRGTEKSYQNLKRKIQLFSKELFDPSYKKRNTSLQKVIMLC